MALKIRKAEEKPMDIHRKKSPKLHIIRNSRDAGGAAAKKAAGNAGTGKMKRAAGNTADAKTKRATENTVTAKSKRASASVNTAKAKRSSEKGTSRSSSIAKRSGSLYNAGMTGLGAAADQLDGGEELRQSAAVMYAASLPAAGVASQGASLARRRELEKKKRRIRKVDKGRRMSRLKARRTVREIEAERRRGSSGPKDRAFRTGFGSRGSSEDAFGTPRLFGSSGSDGTPGTDSRGTDRGRSREGAAKQSRERKIRFFLDKMKAQNEQRDNLLLMVRDLVFNRIGQAVTAAAVAVLPFLLILVLCIAMVAVPVVAVVAALYNSPLALFLPSLEEGETVQEAVSSEITEFTREVITLAGNAEDYGCDSGVVVYLGYEDSEETPSNYDDVLAVYMVRYGSGDTATVINDTSREWIAQVVADMCSYETAVETVILEETNEDGETEEVSVSTLYVNVTLLIWEDMVETYEFDEEEQEMLAELMTELAEGG